MRLLLLLLLLFFIILNECVEFSISLLITTQFHLLCCVCARAFVYAAHEPLETEIQK